MEHKFNCECGCEWYQREIQRKECPECAEEAGKPWQVDEDK